MLAFIFNFDQKFALLNFKKFLVGQIPFDLTKKYPNIFTYFSNFELDLVMGRKFFQ